VCHLAVAGYGRWGLTSRAPTPNRGRPAAPLARRAVGSACQVLKCRPLPEAPYGYLITFHYGVSKRDLMLGAR
jgi:hypothetical protein